jgi:hypothetical protein
MTMTTYADQAGNRYRAVAAVPYSELTPGTPYLYDGRVCFRGTAGAGSFPHLARALPGVASGLYNQRVTLLERVEK